ncbi:MAG: hypothetical protein AAB116_08145 [Candidatus Poribacteria bacterium]
MKTINLKKIVFAFGLVFALSISPVKAGSGGDHSGGGHVGPNGDLFDFYENEGSIKLDPLAVPGVKETLNEVYARVPGLARLLTTAQTKRWYLESKPLNDCPGGESLILADKSTGACQTKIEVRISQSWYEDMSLGEAKTARKKKGIIIHELLRGVKIAAVESIPDEDMIRDMTRTLSLDQLPEEHELRDLALRYKFGYFKTASEIQARNSLIAAKTAQVTKLFADLILLATQFYDAGSLYEAASKQDDPEISRLSELWLEKTNLKYTLKSKNKRLAIEQEIKEIARLMSEKRNSKIEPLLNKRKSLYEQMYARVQNEKFDLDNDRVSKYLKPILDNDLEWVKLSLDNHSISSEFAETFTNRRDRWIKELQEYIVNKYGNDRYGWSFWEVYRLL